MQIAQIIPKVRTQNNAVFDYSIPPEILPEIKIGILVLIPFHGRQINGVVINLKKTSKIENLKNIIKILDPVPVVDEIHLELAKWMADYYLASLGQTLFENIVPPAQKTIKKLQVNTTFFAPAQKVGKDRSLNRKKYKKYLIAADFPARLKFYLQAIQKTLVKNKSIIILIPDLSLIPFFTQYLKAPYATLHSGLSKTQRWIEWDKIRQDKVKIIIGSNSALFAPAKSLGLIIIDQEENETYKNQRSPRFHALTVAEKLSKLTAANLVIGSITPRVETYNRALNNYYLLKKIPFGFKPKISLIDMNTERQILSIPLQEKIEETLNQKKKIILVLNRKGEGTKFACTDCSWIFLCPKCNLPLVPQKTTGVCFRCHNLVNLPESCPRCHNTHLHSFGIGTKRLEKFLQDFWPEGKIIRIEESFLSQVKTPWDIAIATSYALKFKFPKISLVGIIDADQGLNFPDFRASEKNFQTLYKFLKIGEQGIIQTHLPDNATLKALSQLDYEKFFLNELALRHQFHFPPFGRLIRLLYKNADDKIAQKEAHRLLILLKNITNSQPFINLLGPTPAFIKKQRGLFRWQILIKFQSSLPSALITLLKSLTKGWLLDIDPIDLL